MRSVLTAGRVATVLGVTLVVTLWPAGAARSQDACAELRRVQQQAQQNARNMASAGATPDNRASMNRQSGAQVATRDTAQWAYEQAGCGASASGMAFPNVANSSGSDLDVALSALQTGIAIYQMMSNLNAQQEQQRHRWEAERRRLQGLRDQQRLQRQMEENSRDARIRSAAVNVFAGETVAPGADNPFARDDAYVPFGGNGSLPTAIAEDLRARGTAQCPTRSEARNYCSTQPRWWATHTGNVGALPFSADNCVVALQTFASGTRACTIRAEQLQATPRVTNISSGNCANNPFAAGCGGARLPQSTPTAQPTGTTGAGNPFAQATTLGVTSGRELERANFDRLWVRRTGDGTTTFRIPTGHVLRAWPPDAADPYGRVEVSAAPEAWTETGRCVPVSQALTPGQIVSPTCQDDRDAARARALGSR